MPAKTVSRDEFEVRYSSPVRGLPGAMTVRTARAGQVRTAIWLEVFTVLWMVVEAAVSIGAGLTAGSALLIAFGLDSVIELVSGTTLLWRLALEARGGDEELVERAERRAARIVAVLLVLLCIYVLVTAIYGLVTRAQPETAIAGIAISSAAVIVMPLLGIAKRRLASDLDSSALRGDAASSFTCAAMAGAVLAGVALNALFHWWWVEPAASLLFLFWLARETREAFDEAFEPA
jgi:divalent metal cation (Fe/Co/Zn/Cd) transporter